MLAEKITKGAAIGKGLGYQEIVKSFFSREDDERCGKTEFFK